MKSSNKLAMNFYNLSKRALDPKAREGLIVESNYDEEVAFHRLHEVMVKMSTSKNVEDMRYHYPFLKVRGKWCVSVVKMYNYLKAAQGAICQSQDEYMQAVFDVIQTAKRYNKAYQELDDKLVVNGYDNYEGYQMALAAVYEEHMMVQSSIFARVAAA